MHYLESAHSGSNNDSGGSEDEAPEALPPNSGLGDIESSINTVSSAGDAPDLSGNNDSSSLKKTFSFFMGLLLAAGAGFGIAAGFGAFNGSGSNPNPKPDPDNYPLVNVTFNNKTFPSVVYEGQWYNVSGVQFSCDPYGALLNIGLSAERAQWLNNERQIKGVPCNNATENLAKLRLEFPPADANAILSSSLRIQVNSTTLNKTLANASHNIIIKNGPSPSPSPSPQPQEKCKYEVSSSPVKVPVPVNTVSEVYEIFRLLGFTIKNAATCELSGPLTLATNLMLYSNGAPVGHDVVQCSGKSAKESHNIIKSLTNNQSIVTIAGAESSDELERCASKFQAAFFRKPGEQEGEITLSVGGNNVAPPVTVVY